MERTLFHLNKDDIRLLHPKAQLGRVKPGQPLVREGTPPLGLFIVRSGHVLVQRNLIGYNSTVATLGPDEMFGESAFLAHAQPATASVIAGGETDVDVIVLTPQRLNPLFEENPGLSGRFFHSIALALSRRLRAYNLQASAERSDRFGNLPRWEIL